jgi:hypothetical protein
VIEPAGPQRFEATPTVADADGDAEQVAELAVKVAQVALRVMDDADGEVGQAREALGEHPHDDALAGAWIAMHQGEASLSQMSLFDAPAEVLDFG